MCIYCIYMYQRNNFSSARSQRNKGVFIIMFDENGLLWHVCGVVGLAFMHIEPRLPRLKRSASIDFRREMFAYICKAQCMRLKMCILALRFFMLFAHRSHVLRQISGARSSRAIVRHNICAPRSTHHASELTLSLCTATVDGSCEGVLFSAVRL